MDYLIFAAVSKAVAERPPEPAFYDDDDDDDGEEEDEEEYEFEEEHEYEDDILGQEERRRLTGSERSMDCLIFAAVSKAVAERPPEPVFYDDDYGEEEEDEEEYEFKQEHEYEDDSLGQEERRRLTASGLPPGQVREMEEAVRRSEMILGRRLPPPPEVDVEDFIAVAGVMSGALVAGWIGWTLLVLGAAHLMYLAKQIIFQHNQRRRGENRRADAEKELADVRAVLERTGNADLLLPLQDRLL